MNSDQEESINKNSKHSVDNRIPRKQNQRDSDKSIDSNAKVRNLKDF